MSKDSGKTIVYSALEVANICGVVNQTAINWIRNGHLKAFSTPGGQYRVYLDDLIDFMESRGMRIPEELVTQIGEAANSKKSILVVDDDVGLNSVLCKYLSKTFESYEIYQAFDGFEAGAKMVEKKPSCVLLDLDLPGVDGFSLCNKIKTTDDFGKPFVIVITALQEDDLEEKVKSLGADVFFLKPLHLQDIAASLKLLFED